MNQFDKEKISAEIENAIKMPKKEKKNIHKTVLDNIGIAILVLAYFACILSIVNITYLLFGFTRVAVPQLGLDLPLRWMAVNQRQLQSM